MVKNDIHKIFIITKDICKINLKANLNGKKKVQVGMCAI